MSETPRIEILRGSPDEAEAAAIVAALQALDQSPDQSTEAPSGPVAHSPWRRAALHEALRESADPPFRRPSTASLWPD